MIRDEKLKDIANTITNLSAQKNARNSRWSLGGSNIETENEQPTRDQVDNKQKRPQSLSILPSTPSIVSVVKKNSHQQHLNFQKSHERGDPDGDCGLEDEVNINYLMNNVELRVNLPAEEILHAKKGWLLKQDLHSGVWSKYWFSLKGGGLFYYRDPASEERGVLDGVLDVNSITSIQDVTSNRNHAFQLTVRNSFCLLIFFFKFL